MKIYTENLEIILKQLEEEKIRYAKNLEIIEQNKKLASQNKKIQDQMFLSLFENINETLEIQKQSEVRKINLEIASLTHKKDEFVEQAKSLTDKIKKREKELADFSSKSSNYSTSA